VRLARLIRTSSFRLTTLYAVLFVVSVTILFGVVYLSAVDTMMRQIDHTVADELAEVRASAAPSDLAAMQKAVTEFARRSPGLYYLLQDDSGAILAGNMPHVAPVPGRQTLPRTVQSLVARRHAAVRGVGVTIPGGFLFVGASDHELREMKEAIIRAFLLSLAVTVPLALAGGVAMSLGVLRRVETIGRASRDIMAGDLTRRIPVRGAEDEFDHLAGGLNAMLDRIQSLMAGLQQVSSDIAHDLRTPLTRVRQRLELARQREATVGGLHQALDGSIEDVDAILRTFGALLRIAQVEAGTRRSGFVDLDLAPLLEGLVETYQPVAEEREQTLTAAVAEPLMVQGDRELIVQMFANLIENAIRHTPPGTRIAVTGGRTGVAVEDSGPGIPPALREHVLARFARLEASRTTPGDGLGLSMVSAIAQLHGASLMLQDAGPGLRVVVRFSGW
jgi:signal transduction histidine kinase